MGGAAGRRGRPPSRSSTSRRRRSRPRSSCSIRPRGRGRGRAASRRAVRPKRPAAARSADRAGSSSRGAGRRVPDLAVLPQLLHDTGAFGSLRDRLGDAGRGARHARQARRADVRPARREVVPGRGPRPRAGRRADLLGRAGRRDRRPGGGGAGRVARRPGAGRDPRAADRRSPTSAASSSPTRPRPGSRPSPRGDGPGEGPRRQRPGAGPVDDRARRPARGASAPSGRACGSASTR